MIVELEINGARVIISGDNLTVHVTGDDVPTAKAEWMTLGEYLRAHALTQAEFAEIIGSHQVNINRLVNGKRRPSWAMIRRIEEATGGAVSVHSWLPTPSLNHTGEAA